MPLPGLCWIGVKSVERRERVWFNQFPETIIGKILPHMGSCRKQKQMTTTPGERPALFLVWYAGQCLDQTIPISTTNANISAPVGCKLVSLIESNKIIRLHFVLLQAREHALTGQGINADNYQVAPGTTKRIAQTSVAPGNNAKRQVEQMMHLMRPVPY